MLSDYRAYGIAYRFVQHIYMVQAGIYTRTPFVLYCVPVWLGNGSDKHYQAHPSCEWLGVKVGVNLGVK